jgi:hypothetical protein
MLLQLSSKCHYKNVKGTLFQEPRVIWPCQHNETMMTPLSKGLSSQKKVLYSKCSDNLMIGLHGPQMTTLTHMHDFMVLI